MVGSAARTESAWTTVVIPPGDTATFTSNVRALRNVEVTIENRGSGPCEIDAPDGRIPAPNLKHPLAPRERLRLMNIPDDWLEHVTTIFSAEGTTVRVQVGGEPVPMALGKKKTPVRDPETGLITSVLEVPAWVPCP